MIVALGCSPGLGFVHNGHDRGFVFDIADLYKTELATSVAFELIAQYDQGEETNLDLSAVVRRRMRDKFKQEKIVARITQDIKYLLLDPMSKKSNSLLTSFRFGMKKAKMLSVATTTQRALVKCDHASCFGSPAKVERPPHPMAVRGTPQCIRREGECESSRQSMELSSGECLDW